VPRRKLIKRTLLTLLLLVVIAAGGFGLQIYRNIAKVTHNNNPFSLLSVFHPVPLKSQDGRVNILIGGDSADRANATGNGGNLTDSIMVLSIDTKNKTAFMLSIPRDLWTPLPANNSLGSHQKINAANEITSFNQTGYPQGGMGALEYVVNQDFGIQIDYYALVNYNAFQSLVNAVGGITVDIQSPDHRGLYDPQPYQGSKSFKLSNGVQQLNGEQALNLARARGEASGSYGFPNSDFDRTAHQRLMALAIKDKLSSPSVVANPFKLSEIADAIGNNVTTDMKLNEMQSLYVLGKDINDSNIQSFNVNTLIAGKTLLADYWAPDGSESLAPVAGVDNFSVIQGAITRLFSSDPVVKENASVVVLNGSKVVGAAAAEGKILTTKGMTVSGVADAPGVQSDATIIDNSQSKAPATLSELKTLLGTATTVATNAKLTAAYPSAQFIVILGANQAAAIQP
jgi:LCP family protein required for cell wall assembly